MNTSGIKAPSSTTTRGAQAGRTAARPTDAFTTDRSGSRPVQSDSLDFMSAVAQAPAPIDAETVRALRRLVASESYLIDHAGTATAMIAADLRA